MNPALQFLQTVLALRVDALAFAGLLVAGFVLCSHALRDHDAALASPRVTAGVLVILGLVGIITAECIGGHVGTFGVVGVALRRALALGTAAFLAAFHLRHAAEVAHLRAALRAATSAARDLEKSRDAAEHANRAKSDFLALMCHEIRTPLNALMGFAHLLANTRLDETQRGYVTTIAGEGKRLGAVMNDVLDLRQIEQGRVTLDRLPFAPAEIAREVVELFRARAQEKQLDLDFDSSAPATLLNSGDPVRFRQVVVNLVDNAIKFTSRGSVKVAVSYTPSDTAAAGQLTVAVRDTGIGMSALEFARLLQNAAPTGAAPARGAGAGLGLAITQRLVRLMGGKMGGQSTPGQGSEFSFSLPMTPLSIPPAAGAPVEKISVDAGHAPVTPPHARVLIVDDVAANRVLLQIFLQRQGFAADHAADGEEAVRLASRQRYDAILMDVQMPGMDGFTATQRIREAETPEHRTLILGVTACIAKDTRDRCLASGMDEHFTKPLDLRRFCRTLNHLLAARANRRSVSRGAVARINRSPSSRQPQTAR